MKLSGETLAILQNFSGINQSILIRQGDNLSTISASKNIFAHAKVQEHFEREIGIYDLDRFLGVVKLYDSVEIEFHEQYMVIRNANNKKQYTRYYYSSSNVIISPPNKNISFPEKPTVSFNLSQKEFQNMVRGCNIMKLPDVEITGQQGEFVTIKGVDSSNVTMGDFNHTTSIEADTDFSFIISVESISKLMPGDYVIEVSDQRIAKFYNQTTNVMYFIAVLIRGDK
jgi:hypothetical protein